MSSSRTVHEILVQLRGKRYAVEPRRELCEIFCTQPFSVALNPLVEAIASIPGIERELACEDVILAYVHCRLKVTPYPPLLAALQEAFVKCDELLSAGMSRHEQAVQEIRFGVPGLGLRLGAIARRWMHPWKGYRTSQMLRVIRFMHAGAALRLKRQVFVGRSAMDAQVSTQAQAWLTKAHARLPDHVDLRTACETFVRDLP